MSVFLDAAAAQAAAIYFDRVADRLQVQAVLFSTWSVMLGRLGQGGVFQPVSPQAQWTATTPQNGQATIGLGDGYTLLLNEHRSQIQIVNDTTGEVTNIWGDPHIDWNQDGRTDADFWTTTTFTLENGTKITIDTEPWNGNQNMYVASKLTITNGSNAIVVDGISQNQKGDLAITQHSNGYMLDALTHDGFTVYENPCGEGWLTASGDLATQEDFDITKPGAQPSVELDDAFGAALGAFLMTGALIGALAALNAMDALDG